MEIVEAPPYICECGDQLDVYWDREEDEIFVRCHNPECKAAGRILYFKPSRRTVYLYSDSTNLGRPLSTIIRERWREQGDHSES